MKNWTMIYTLIILMLHDNKTRKVMTAFATDKNHKKKKKNKIVQCLACKECFIFFRS